MRLSHNIASLNIYTAQSKVLKNQSTALQRISSGYKVNTAKDDPNVIAQSERMTMQIRGLQMAGQNTQDGVSMLQTAEGGLDSMTQMVQRVRELVVQAGSASNTEDDRKTIQNEINQMIDGMDNIANNTEFNGLKLLNPTDTSSLKMPVGANAGENVDIPQFQLTSDNLKTLDGKKLSEINITQGGNYIDDALGTIDNALNTIVSVRSKYGALENRFQDGLTDINQISDTISGAQSSLTDADIASEMAEYAKDNILAEAGTAMMAQSNKLPQDALTILQNIRSR